MAVPALPGRGPDPVVLEDRGVVHEHRDRPAEAGGGRGDEGPGLGTVEQVGGDHHGLHRKAAHLLGERFGGLAAGMAMDGHVEAAARERPDERGADALRPAGHQCRTVAHHAGVPLERTRTAR